MIIKNFKVSKYFWFNEIVSTSYLEFAESNIEESIKFLHDATDFARYILDECREYLGPFSPGSWFRGVELNYKVGGSTNSAHMRGLAVDYTRWSAWDKLQEAGRGLYAHLTSKGNAVKIIMESKDGAYWLHIGAAEKSSLWTGISGVYKKQKP